MKFKLKWLLMVLLNTSSTGVTAAEVESPSVETTNALSLDEVVREVLSSNPWLKAARANWESTKQRVPQARAWEDLKVGVDVERSGTTRFDTFTDNEWMMAQEIPISGKNRLRGKATVAEAAAAYSELRRGELDLTARARAAYYRLANAQEQLSINRKNGQLLKQFVEISRAKYEAGTKPQADVLIAETDLARVEENRYDIQRQISDAQSKLNVFMNRPARQAFGRPSGLPFFAVELFPEPIEASALRHRPELLAAQRKIEATQARYDLAKREWIPDPELRVEARQFNGAGGGIQEYDTGIFFKVPWLNRKKYKAAIEEARQAKESAEHELEAARKETLGIIRDQLKQVETFHHHTELFRAKIVPLARQNVTSALAGYETDQSGFLNLIEAQRTLQEVESMYWNHLTDYLVSLAELEAAVGVSPLHQASTPAENKRDLP